MESGNENPARNPEECYRKQAKTMKDPKWRFWRPPVKFDDVDNKVLDLKAKK
jgi:hypothetical protein